MHISSIFHLISWALKNLVTVFIYFFKSSVFLSFLNVIAWNILWGWRILTFLKRNFGFSSDSLFFSYYLFFSGVSLFLYLLFSIKRNLPITCELMYNFLMYIPIINLIFRIFYRVYSLFLYGITCVFVLFYRIHTSSLSLWHLLS